MKKIKGEQYAKTTQKQNQWHFKMYQPFLKWALPVQFTAYPPSQVSYYFTAALTTHRLFDVLQTIFWERGGLQSHDGHSVFSLMSHYLEKNGESAKKKV